MKIWSILAKLSVRRLDRRWLPLWGLFLLFFVWLYFFLAAMMIRETNQDRTATDQQHNIELARRSAEHIWPYYTDGVVNPLWPWFIGKFQVPDDQDFFTRGKWVNVILTALFLVALYLALTPHLPLLPLLNLTLCAGLGALLPHAVYFQPEPLYYLFFFGVWIVSWHLLFSNSLMLYGLNGLLAGFAYLAKSSVLPLIAVFVGASLLRWLLDPKIKGWRDRDGEDCWRWRRMLGGLAVMGVAFALVILPRAVYSWNYYGSPLHSYPSYWMWHDDFGRESVPFMLRHPSREQLAKLTPEERPSLRNYLETHSRAEVRERLGEGMRAKLKRFLLPEKKFREWDPEEPHELPLRYRGLYLGGFLALLLALGLVCGAYRLPVLLLIAAPAAFIVGGFLVYWMAYGWYHPIGRGDRFMMSLYLPLLFTFVWSGWMALTHRSKLPARVVFAGGHMVIAAFLWVRIVQLLAQPHFQ